MTRRLGKSSSPRRSVQMKHSLPSRPNSAHRRTILFPRYTCQQKARSLASRSDPQRVLPVRASERATRMPVWSGRLSHERSTKQSALTEGRRLVRFRQVCGTGNPQRWSRLQLPRLSTVNSRHAEEYRPVWTGPGIYSGSKTGRQCRRHRTSSPIASVLQLCLPQTRATLSLAKSGKMCFLLWGCGSDTSRAASTERAGACWGLWRLYPEGSPDFPACACTMRSEDAFSCRAEHRTACSSQHMSAPPFHQRGKEGDGEERERALGFGPGSLAWAILHR